MEAGFSQIQSHIVKDETEVKKFHSILAQSEYIPNQVSESSTFY